MPYDHSGDTRIWQPVTKIQTVAVQITDSVFAQPVRLIPRRLDDLDSVRPMPRAQLIGVIDDEIDRAGQGRRLTFRQENLHAVKVDARERRRIAFGEGHDEAVS